MPVLSTGQLTLADVSKRFNADGKVDPVAELLSQQNDILEDAVFVEANQPTSHVVSVRTGLPAVYWRSYNQGVPSSKSTTAQVTEPCAMLEARSHIDAKLLQLNGNSAAWRLGEETAFIEAMGQEMAAKMFNGNVGADLRTFSGFATRYSSSTAGNGQNVILAGGAGADNASMYLIGWGEQTVFCPFPKGSSAGLKQRDLGEESVTDAAGGFYQAARSLYQWDAGLVVKDWRYAARIANKNNCRLAFYANRSVYEGLMIQALDRSQNVLKVEDAINQFGQDIKQLSILGVPCRLVDHLGVDVSATAAGAATVTFEVITSANSDLSSPNVLVATGAVGKAELTAGRAPISLCLPPSVYAALPVGQRYLGVRYTVATGPLTAGSFTCYLSNTEVHGAKYYASGFTVL